MCPTLLEPPAYLALVAPRPESEARGLGRLDDRTPRQIGGPDQAGVVAEVREHQPRFGPEPSTSQRPGESPPGRDEQQIAGRTDATSDDHHFGIQRGGQVGDASTEPGTDVG